MDMRFPSSQFFAMAPSISILVLSWILLICCFPTFQAHQMKITPNDTMNPFSPSYDPSQENSEMNVIDACWRKDPKWNSNRQALANCPKGYGANAQGGKSGNIYVVTDPSDDPINPKLGTLRYGVIQTNPLWIIFKRSMSIRLEMELLVNSYKTIDGRGAKVEIANGAGIRIENASHVIIHGISIRNCVRMKPGLVRIDPDNVVNRSTNYGADGDAIRVTSSTNVWIDHCSLSNSADGLLDISLASNAVTISNNHLTQHKKVMLFGHSDDYPKDKEMYVTVVFNHFGPRLVQRIPRVRFGYAHVANNKYDPWLMYAIGGSSNPTILSEGNHYTASDDPNAKEVTKRNSDDPNSKNWKWNSRKDLFLNGAFFVTSGKSWTPSYTEAQAFVASPAKSVPTLTRDAGPLHCIPNQPC